MRIRLSLAWCWYDFWVGLYWDREARVLYACPLPTFVVRIELSRS